ncbi:MAG TPA: ATP-binding cassette domain-containing protein [Terriglobales bacterium]|nr:ATP-binding cassette domain-containing protein [Terriglobales bacterium]
MVAIDLQNVSKRYPGGGRGVLALDSVALSVEAGEWLAVMGPSGSGKTTLVHLVGGLERPTSGSLIVAGADLAALSPRELARFRAETIGFVFQQFHLVPYLTALENVMLAQYFHSLADAAEAEAALAAVGLADRARHLPAQLSGGEQQRVVLARALINDPAILLADEPTGNLDEDNELRVLELLRRAHAAGKTIVMVTHDPTVASLADRRVQLHHGRITDISWLTAGQDEQWDEILEQLWILRENHEPAIAENIRVAGPLPLANALDSMRQAGLIAPNGLGWRLAPEGERRASDIIRRHRLAELLFSDTLELHDEAQVQAQACKFEHILSPEATARICSFLGHPRACPHGSPIPLGECCPREAAAVSRSAPAGERD